jgi:hypothetical protein
MILCHNRTTGPSGTGAVSFIMREMDHLFGSMDEEKQTAARDVASGVQTFLAEGIPASVDSNHVRALTSRALICAGRKDLASRLLLLGGGLVKQSQSALVDEGAVFILNLKQMVVTNDECLDLMFQKCLLLLMESMGHMWDEAGGRGMLGLRNVRVAAAAVLGKGAATREVDALARETRFLCGRKLEVLRHRRKWQECPFVFDLDWVSTAKRRRRKGRIS